MTGFGLGADQTLALGRYLDLLLDWRRANVTAVRTRDEAADRLVGDSLALLDVPELETAGRRWLDLGAGAGIPGIPLALARPDVRLSMKRGRLVKDGQVGPRTRGRVGLISLSPPRREDQVGWELALAVHLRRGSSTRPEARGDLAGQTSADA